VAAAYLLMTKGSGTAAIAPPGLTPNPATGILPPSLLYSIFTTPSAAAPPQAPSAITDSG